MSASSTPGYSNAITQLLQKKCFTRYATTAGKLVHCHRGKTSSNKLLMTKNPGLQRSDEACQASFTAWNAAHSQSFVTEQNDTRTTVTNCIICCYRGLSQASNTTMSVLGAVLLLNVRRQMLWQSYFVFSEFSSILSATTFSLELAFDSIHVYILLYLSLKLVKSRPKDVEANPTNNRHKQSGNDEHPVISSSSQLQQEQDVSTLLIQSAASEAIQSATQRT